MRKNDLREKYDLSLKIDRFIKEYAKGIKGTFTDFGEYNLPKKIRNYIEAQAVFAELRHPFGSWGGREDLAGAEQNNKAKEQFSWEFFSTTYNTQGFGSCVKVINLMTLYRVLERGGERAINRALEFAQDRHIDKSIPLCYGAQHLPTEQILSFMPPLSYSALCPINYFTRESDDFKDVREMSIRDILEERCNHDEKAKKAVAIL